MIRNEYVHNKKFRDYVDKYAKNHGITADEALEHKEIESCEIAVKVLEEIQQYRAIGTVEECREAIEKQNPQPPDIWGDGCDKEGNIIYDMYDCPGCGQSYEIDDKYEHCPKCGQALEWRGFENL